ncbi:MAG: M14 metallopeptidase family protein [Dehalobacterium sp.]
MKRSAFMCITVCALVLTLALSCFILTTPVPALSKGNIQSPTQYLGIEIGADRVLADWDQMVKYFGYLDKESNCLQLETIGETTLGESMIMATITAPNNMAKLDKYKEIQKKLAHPANLSKSEADKLIAEGKPIVVISAAIHSTEIAGTQMLLQLAHKLASADTDEVKEILDKVIILMIPALNPDGHKMTVDWYRNTLSTPYEGSGTPWLYHEYVGHDTNRDWYMFHLNESQAVAKKLYQEWFPQIVYDIHQMGNTGCRFFVPPYYDPFNPEIDPLILRSIMMLGGHITTDLQAKGLGQGVVTNAIYDAWKSGAMRDHVYYHNIVGILTEAANAKIATPIQQTPEELTRSSLGLPDALVPATNFPEPWPGGTWRMKDIMNYEESACWSLLTLAARYDNMFVKNFYELGMKGIEKGKTEAPSAYIIPPDQRDPVTAAKLVDIMIFQDIQVNKAEESFSADGKVYPAGSYVILTSQPTRANVKMLLGKQNYPDRLTPDGTPERPYDVAGWTLWMQMGVNCVEIEKPFTAKMTEVKQVDVPAGIVANGDATYGYIFGPELNNTVSARFRLLEDGYNLLWTTESYDTGNRNFAPGSTIVKMQDGLQTKLNSLSKDLGVSFYPLASQPNITTQELRVPRIGIYESWIGNMDSGWTRFILDKLYQIPNTKVFDAEIRAGNLNNKFDVILIPQITRNDLVNGRKEGSYPPEYCGGIGTEGVNNLRAFVENGGTLLTLDTGGEFAIEDLKIPVKDVTKSVNTKDFYCPGSILQVNVDNNNSLAFGMNNVADIYFHISPVYEIVGDGPVPVLSYGENNPIRSGWILGPGLFKNKVAMLEAPLGDGKIVMIGFRSQFRAQPYGTFKLLFNSFFDAVAK